MNTDVPPKGESASPYKLDAALDVSATAWRPKSQGRPDTIREANTPMREKAALADQPTNIEPKKKREKKNWVRVPRTLSAGEVLAQVMAANSSAPDLDARLADAKSSRPEVAKGPAKPPMIKKDSKSNVVGSAGTRKISKRPSMQVLSRTRMDSAPINVSATDFSTRKMAQKRSRTSFSKDGDSSIRIYIEQLGKFVPSRVINHYMTEAQLGHKEVTTFADVYEGAVLFADISGFSKLGEDLEELIGRGPGAKKLGEEVAGALIPLVNMILEWGGDVIKFAGDAIFAVFDATSTGQHKDMQTATISACVCARKMVNFSLHNAESNIRLDVHCGVGSGKVVGMHVGGVQQRWDYCISGDALAESVSCEGDSLAGQVVVSPSVREHIELISTSEPIADSLNYELTSLLPETLGRHRDGSTKKLAGQLQKLDKTALHTLYTRLVPYVVEPVIKSVDNGHGVWVGEVRSCVTLFLRLTGVKHGNESDVCHIHNIMKLVQSKMYGYTGANFFRLIVDDKGMTNLWAFGLKWSMNQNYALNAVLAAIETHKALKEKRRSCAVGITYGRVFCGTVGGIQRCEFTLHGTQVNLAARLMSKAGDGVLCDEAVYKATHDMIDYADPVQTKVKGKVEPITVHRALRLKSSATGMMASIKLKRVTSNAIMIRSKRSHPARTPRALEKIAASFSERDNKESDGSRDSSAVLDMLSQPFVETKPKRKNFPRGFCVPRDKASKEIKRQQSKPLSIANVPGDDEEEE